MIHPREYDLSSLRDDDETTAEIIKISEISRDVK